MSPGSAGVYDNPAPPETRIRSAAKRVLWRVLPPKAYAGVLARAKLRDFRSGRLSEPEIELARRALRPGDTAADVGANHGLWTVALAEAVGPNGRVYAFEPVPFTFSTLGAVARLSGQSNITLIPRGCSESPGAVRMAVPLQDSGASDDMQAHLADRDQGSLEGQRLIECEMTTVDEALADVESLALIKLDVEGAELLALRGGAATIERHRPLVICELDETFLAGFGQKPADVVDFLAQRRYAAYRYEPNERRLVALADPDAILHANAVFVHERQRDRLSGVLQ